MSAITPITGSTSGTSSTASNPGQTLTQADFLQLMVAQFTDEDPLATGDSSGGGDSGTSSYVNELMSMTNLTTMQNMSAQQGLMASAMLPGATVEVQGNNGPVTGLVQNVTISNGTVSLTVNGQSYPSSSLLSVNQSEAQAAAAAAAASTNGTTPTGTSSSYY